MCHHYTFTLFLFLRLLVSAPYWRPWTSFHSFLILTLTFTNSLTFLIKVVVGDDLVAMEIWLISVAPPGVYGVGIDLTFGDVGVA